VVCVTASPGAAVVDAVIEVCSITGGETATAHPTAGASEVVDVSIEVPEVSASLVVLTVSVEILATGLVVVVEVEKFNGTHSMTASVVVLTSSVEDGAISETTVDALELVVGALAISTLGTTELTVELDGAEFGGKELDVSELATGGLAARVDDGTELEAIELGAAAPGSVVDGTEPPDSAGAAVVVCWAATTRAGETVDVGAMEVRVRED
jgi:hypothetical protein